jgi:hypothetical protein
MNIGTHASRVALAEMAKTFLRELEDAANELDSLPKQRKRPDTMPVEAGGRPIRRRRTIS